MWFNKKKFFLFFYCGETSLINTEDNKSFRHIPFSVSLVRKREWANSEEAVRLSPETLTYWNEE